MAERGGRPPVPALLEHELLDFIRREILNKKNAEKAELWAAEHGLTRLRFATICARRVFAPVLLWCGYSGTSRAAEMRGWAFCSKTCAFTAW